MYKRLFEVDEWLVKTHEVPTNNMRLYESLMGIANGFMGMRGNFEESYSGDTHRGSYIAGVWFPDKTRVGWWKNGYPEYFGKVVNSIDYIGARLTIDGTEVDINVQDIRDFEASLDMQNGILARKYIVKINQKEIALKFERFLSIVKQNIAAIRITAEALDDESVIQFTPYLNGDVTNEDSNYGESFWEADYHPSQVQEPYIQMMTKPNDFEVKQFKVAALMSNFVDSQLIEDRVYFDENHLYVEQSTKVTLQKGQVVAFNKIISLTNDRRDKDVNIIDKAAEVLKTAVDIGYEALKVEHQAAWKKRWEIADIHIDGDVEAQQGIRFNIFQLFSTYYGKDASLNIGPKGFTGEKYGGATYWDTEAFIFPMYLSIAEPDVTEQLLKYRWYQLEGAYHNAKQQGLAGALYPMVTFNGIECHNEWEITFEEIHRNGAIAHAIWNFTNYTGDKSYLFDKGIEVLVAISRFWASRVHWNDIDKRYEMHGVTGPNEYENNVNNNYHTNNMARFTLEFTLDTLKEMAIADVINDRMSVEKVEIEYWQDIMDHIYINYDGETHIFMQHDGFMQKQLIPVAELADENLPLHQKWSWDRILRSPYIKQADVLQSMYMLNHEYSDEQVNANFKFYEPYTVHESSLSASIHSILASQIGERDKAYELYQRTARLDLDNYNNDTEDGLHITSMSGAWLAIVHGFAGMRIVNNRLHFRPFLPKEWRRFDFMINYRGRRIQIEITSGVIQLQLVSGKAVDVVVNESSYQLINNISVKIE